MEEKKENVEENVGIICMESYFPKLYISQKEFESFNNVSPGKYTIGLGQKEMSFVTEREDICSISLTVLSNLINKNNISYTDIGWICVATETIIDHSKSISSMLMQLFQKNGNHQIEGIDCKHACYAGSYALFSAFDRVSSKYWDGKYCIVIAADIAEYDNGPARCTGGCGAVAMLIGKNGCIELNRLRSSYKANEYDFYKPHLNSPYPVVNGHVSNACYINALDSCYNALYNKYNQSFTPFTSDYWVFHSPYTKLVQKSYGRVIYNHFLREPQFYYDKYQNDESTLNFLKKYENISANATISTREVIKGFEKISRDFYKRHVEPSTLIPKMIGNCYTASIFMGLISLICECGDDMENKLIDKNISLFSYGSGTMASLYSLKIHKTSTAVKQLKQIVTNNDVQTRFAKRTKIDCERFTKIMEQRNAAFHQNTNMINDFVPEMPINDSYFFTETFYLTKMDKTKQRFYSQHHSTEIKEEKTSLTHIMVEHEINENIARNKCDSEDEMEIDDNNNNNSNNKRFKLPNIGKLVHNQLMKHSKSFIQTIKLKQEESGGLLISKKGAIKIDEMLNTAEEVSTNCSYQ